MIPSSCFVFFTILIIIKATISLDEDYYWREYTGTIPGDAIEGGKDINGKNVYIGQAYEKDVGLIPVQIYTGVREVFVPLNGQVKKVDKYTKILCGLQENFYWVPANFRTLHLTLNDKHAVIGGHIDNSGLINIGRITYQGETKIGRILSYQVGKAHFFFNNDGREGVNIKTYEILTYKNQPLLIDPRNLNF